MLSVNASLLSAFEQHAEDILNQLDQSDTYTNRVIQEITRSLHGEVPSIEAIAHNLAISIRHLQAEGTSYQQLLDATRKELALRYLKKLNVTVHDVAFLLGFSEPSAGSVIDLWVMVLMYN